MGDGTSIVRGLFIEMFLTAELVFTIFMLAAEKHKATFIAPIGIGLALFIGELSGYVFPSLPSYMISYRLSSIFTTGFRGIPLTYDAASTSPAAP